MDNNRIDRVLATLPALLFAGDHLGARSLLEELYDAGADDALADLCGVEQAAALWDVGERRARMHIARMHVKHGVARQFGGTWLIKRGDIEAYPPDKKYRPKPKKEHLG